MAEYQKGNFTPKPRVKTILDERKLALTAPPSNGAQRPHELKVNLYNNNPGLTVFTNIPNDKHGGVIRAGMDALAFSFMLERIMAVADFEGEVTEIIDNKAKVKDEATGKNVLQTESRTVIGKGKDGKVFLSVLSPDNERPKLRFVFQQHYYHPISRSNGQVLTEAEVSVAMARGWVKLMRNLVPAAMTHAYVPPAPQGGSGGGSSWNKGGGNSHANNPREKEESSSFEFDDLPM